METNNNDSNTNIDTVDNNISTTKNVDNNISTTKNVDNNISTTNIDTVNFRDMLSEEFKKNPTLEPYKDLNSLAKSHIELNKLLGKSIRVPGEDATEEDINKFYSKLGRPETYDKYEFSKPENMPEDFKIDDESLKSFKELSHKLGLTNNQADSLRLHYLQEGINLHNENLEKAQKIEKEFIEKGKSMFGDKYNYVMENASKLISENLPEEQKKVLDKLDNESLLSVANLLNNLHSKFFKPDNINDTYSSVNNEDSMRDELISLNDKISKINKQDPNYKDINSRINELYAKGVKIYK